MGRSTGKRKFLPLIALDRDGTLIDEGDYLKDPRRVRLLPGIIGPLKRLKQAGFKLVILSNQSGVGRGIMTLEEMGKVNRRFRSLFVRRGIGFDGVYYCVHRPERDCSCRKPKLGMLKKAASALKRPWRNAISIGDRPTDVQVGQSSGGLGVLVLTGYGRRWAKHPEVGKPDFVAHNLKQAVDWILKKREERA